MIVVDPNGRAWVVSTDAVNDNPTRQAERAETARRTSTPDGWFKFMQEHGTKEGARRIHDAMCGYGSSRETPNDTPAGRNAKEWGR